MKPLIFLVAISLNACKKDCVPTNSLECLCTGIFDPVCGCDNITYPSACNAECVGITNFTTGKCK